MGLPKILVAFLILAIVQQISSALTTEELHEKLQSAKQKALLENVSAKFTEHMKNKMETSALSLSHLNEKLTAISLEDQQRSLQNIKEKMSQLLTQRKTQSLATKTITDCATIGSDILKNSGTLLQAAFKVVQSVFTMLGQIAQCLTGSAANVEQCIQNVGQTEDNALKAALTSVQTAAGQIQVDVGKLSTCLST